MMLYIKLPFNPPDGSNGCANACFIRIRKGYENDKGLFAHEICHIEQFWNNPFTHSFRYKWNKAYRLDCELKAYRIQLSYETDQTEFARHLDLYATWISAPGWKDGYNLQDIVTREQALQLLS